MSSLNWPEWILLTAVGVFWLDDKIILISACLKSLPF